MPQFADEDIRAAQLQDFVFYWSARFSAAISGAQHRAHSLQWLRTDDSNKWVSDGVPEHEEYFRQWKACFIAETVQFEQFLGRSLLYERFPQVPAWMRDASRLARRGLVGIPKNTATILDIKWPTDDPTFMYCSKLETKKYLLNCWWDEDVPKHESVTLSKSIKRFRNKIGRSWEPQQVARSEDQYLALSVVRTKTQLERAALNLAQLQYQQGADSLEGQDFVNVLREARLPGLPSQ